MADTLTSRHDHRAQWLREQLDTPADATAALEAIRRQERAAGKAEGMREARELTRDWIPAVARDAILARADQIEKGASRPMSACTATTGPAAQCPHRTDGWRVKPLEWVDGLSKHVAARAPIPFMNDCYTIWSDFSLHGCKDGPRNEYPTLEAAKAAAQADYEARILAAIEPAAPTVAEACADQWGGWAAEEAVA